MTIDRVASASSRRSVLIRRVRHDRTTRGKFLEELNLALCVVVCAFAAWFVLELVPRRFSQRVRIRSRVRAAAAQRSDGAKKSVRH